MIPPTSNPLGAQRVNDSPLRRLVKILALVCDRAPFKFDGKIDLVIVELK